MSLIWLQHRKVPGSVKHGLIAILITVLCVLSMSSGANGGITFYSDLSSMVDSASDGNSNHHRIQRTGETVFYRNENVRWKKTIEMDGRRAKRNTDAHSIAKANSTKLLNFSSRNIERINFSELDFREPKTVFSDIIVLNFSNNKIVDLKGSGVERFANVERMDLSHNRIVTFSSAFDRLTFLNLSNNRVEHFASKRIPNVRVLDLSGNRISYPSAVAFQYFSDIEMIDLSCNNLTELDQILFQNLTKLNVLNLSGNRLVKILKNYFCNIESIQTLVLADNDISDIENDTFAYLPNLEYLDLSYNDIDVTSIRALQGIPDLVGLSVAYNRRLGNALQGFVASWSLKELDASGTGLCQIPAALAQSVHTLTIAHNHFQMIRCGDLDSYPLLQYLDLSSNHIINIEDDALGRLEILTTLKLSNNNLTNIPSSLPSSLQHLFLQNNQITDIQPNVFVQLINLETLDLSMNKLTYLPGLPLPKLMTLNLRSSGLRGLSQSVVKTSPNLKDVLLENNPIKCTELLGIAEWATPCRSDNVLEFGVAETRHIVGSPTMEETTFNRHKSCSHHKRSTSAPICLSEKLIISSRLPNGAKRNENKAKANREHLRHIKDNGKNTVSTNLTDYNNKTQSTSEDVYLNRKLDDNNGVLELKKLESSFINSSSLNPDKMTAINGIETKNKTATLTTGLAKGLGYVMLVPNGLKMSKQDMILTANTTSYDANNSMSDETLLSKSKSTAKPTKHWKNISKTNNKNEEVLPILRKYFTNNSTGIGSSRAVKTPSNLHTAINQTSTSNKNSLRRKTTPFSVGNKFNENQTPAGVSTTSVTGYGSLERVSTENSVKNGVLCKVEKCGGKNGSNSDDNHFQNDKNVIQSSSTAIYLQPRQYDYSNTSRENSGKKRLESTSRRQLRNKKVDKLKQQANDKLKAETDVYMRDEAKPQKIAETNKKEQPSNSGNDKLDNLADSLAQMMTRQKGYNILTQTGLPIAKHGIVAVDVTPQQNKQLKSPLQIQQQKHQSYQPKYSKKEIINWNTNNPISQQDNETTNIKQADGLSSKSGGNGGGGSNVSNGDNEVMQRDHLIHHQTYKYQDTIAEKLPHTQQSETLLIRNSYTNFNRSNKVENVMQQPLQKIANAAEKSHVPETIESYPRTESTVSSTPSNMQSEYRSSEIIGSIENSMAKLTDHYYDGNVHHTPRKGIISTVSKHKKLKSNENISITIPGYRHNTNNSNNNAIISSETMLYQNEMKAHTASDGKKDGLPSESGIIKTKMNANNITFVTERAERKKDSNDEDTKTDFMVRCNQNGNEKCENIIYIAGKSLDTELKLDSAPVPAKNNGRKNINSIKTDGGSSIDVIMSKELKQSATKQSQFTAGNHSNDTMNKEVDNEAMYYNDDDDGGGRHPNRVTVNRKLHPSIVKDEAMPVVLHNRIQDSVHNNSSTSSGISEQWNDIRNGPSHPGLFIVIGVTIGMFVSLALIHLYRCRKPCQRQRNYKNQDDDLEQYTPAHRDLLPMEILDSTTIHYTDAPIDLW